MGIVSKSLHYLHGGWNRLSGQKQNYRHWLWEELKAYRQDRKFTRILEIGPKDGEDTRRLLALQPEKLVLLDLPDKKEALTKKLADLAGLFELHIGNFMYEDLRLGLFDLVWCTGVLYHNPEQLRMIRRLFDILQPGGVLVLETATARRPFSRFGCGVEIWYEESARLHRRYHVSRNVTHLPSRKGVQAWLSLVGFMDVQASSCFWRTSLGLHFNRAAFFASKPESQESQRGIYYAHAGLAYEVGKSL